MIEDLSSKRGMEGDVLMIKPQRSNAHTSESLGIPRVVLEAALA